MRKIKYEKLETISIRGEKNLWLEFVYTTKRRNEKNAWNVLSKLITKYIKSGEI